MPEGLKMYELARAYRIIKDAMEEEQGGFEESLNQIEEGIEQKAHSCVCLMKELVAEANAYDAEAKKLLEVAQARRKHADRIKAYVLGNLTEARIDKVQGPLYKIMRLFAQPKVEIIDENSVPNRYKEIETRVIVHVDKKAIAEVYKKHDCAQIRGTRTTQEPYLRIYP